MKRSEFIEVVTSLGLVTRGELSSLPSGIGSADSSDSDAQTLARRLVETGKLTRYQAAAIYQGKGKSLEFGDYLVIDRVGTGGMGQVFKARHRRMDRIVALKVMSTSATQDAESIRRFEREVKAAARLMHLNIVTALDAGAQDGVHYLVMEFVDGPDLASVVRKLGKLPVREACDYIAQAARGFAFAHGKGIVHRDIKPGNLLLGRDGTVKVLDMGLARFEDGAPGDPMDAELTRHGAVMGTVDYMAPEQALSTRHADARSDVYGLGCTLYRLLTGEAVFGGTTTVEKILAHRSQPVPKVRRLRADAPPALEGLLERMLAKSPTDRPSMQEIADTLTAIQSGSPLPPVSAYSPAPHPALPPMVTGFPSPAVPVAASVPGIGPAMGSYFTPAAPSGSGPLRPTGAARPPKRSNLPIYTAAGIAILVGVPAIWFILNGKSERPVATAPTPESGVASIVPEAAPAGTAPMESTPIGAASSVAPAMSPSGAATTGTQSGAGRPSGTAPRVDISRPPTAEASATSAGRTVAAVPVSAVATPSTMAAAQTAPGTSRVALGNAAGAAEAPAALADARLPVPDAEKRKKALELIKTVYEADYAAARNPAKKAALAAKLFEQFLQSADATEKYVLLEEIIAQAAASDNVGDALAALNKLVAQFDVNIAVSIDAWKAALAGARPPEVVRQILNEANTAFETSVWRAEFDDAELIGNFVAAATQRLRDAAATKLAREKNAALPARRKEYEVAVAAEQKLATAPDDPEANLAVGRYRGLVERAWFAALPHQAKGSDPVWKAQAEKAIAAGSDPVSMAAVADSWWNAAQTPQARKTDLTTGALFWYEAAVASLEGVQKARVEGRIAEARRLAPPNPLPATLLPSSRADEKTAANAATGGPVTSDTPIRRIKSYDEVVPLLMTGAVTPRAIAERVLSIRGTLLVRTPDLMLKDVKSTVDLPTGDFDILTIEADEAGTIGDLDLVSFGSLKKLERLRLQKSKVTGSGFAYLKDLPELRHLTVNDCPLNDDGLAHLRGGVPKLSELDIAWTGVTDVGASHLRSLTRLKYLNLRETSITNEGMNSLAELTGLEDLNLEDTSVGDAGIAAIGNLSKLRFLSLRNTRITNLAVTTLAKLKALELLWLSKTGVTEPAAQSLRKQLPEANIKTSG